jgi:hypothetical protein
MINTSGTRYSLGPWSENVYVFRGWQDFLKKNTLLKFENFFELNGNVVDINKRSVVHRITFGESTDVFYLKVHENYTRKDISTFFKRIPVVQIELENLMYYGRCRLDALEPVATGWQYEKKTGRGFLLLQDLTGFKSLQKWLSDTDFGHNKLLLQKMTNNLADMVSTIHENGLAHTDLYSWHIFMKRVGDDFICQPIDLERTEKSGKWLFSQWFMQRKQARDLAVLFLTVPWPLVSATGRLRFFLRYRNHPRLTKNDKRLIRLILKIAKRLGKRSKFKPFGIGERFTSSL